MTTIHDIAKEAGVSPGLVSMALNGKPRVSPDTAKKILEIADSMGYRRRVVKTPGAGSVRFVHFSCVGSHLLSSHSPFYADYINGAQTYFQEKGYRCEVSAHSVHHLASVGSTLAEDGIQGAIVLATEVSHEEIRVFETCPLPIVFLDAMYDYLPFDCCDMNNTDAIHMIMDTLYAQGHRKFGLVDGDIRTPNLEARSQAFTKSLTVLGLSTKQQRSYFVPTDASLAAEVLRDEFQRHRPPSALICLTDNFAYGCLRALSLLNIRVPEEVSVMGFDDLPSSRVMHPPLSTIKVPTHAMGAEAARLLEARIINPDKPVEKISFGCELVLRKSHAPK